MTAKSQGDNNNANSIANDKPKLLTRAQIFAAHDLDTEDVPVPEWANGDAVCVRVSALTATDRDAFEQSCVMEVGGESKFTRVNIRAKLCARSIVDENGKRIFTDSDVMALGQKSAAALDRVFAVAMRLSKISGDDVKKLEKNSDSDDSVAPLSLSH